MPTTKRGSFALAAIWLAVSPPTLADAPLPPPATYVIRSSSPSCFAVSDAPKATTTAFKTTSTGGKVELWKVAGWHRVAVLSGDCRHLVVGYGGQNLIPLDYDPATVMLRFYRMGSPVREVRFDELIRDRSRLVRTASHYSWGRLGRVDGHLLHVDTVDRGDLVFDMETGLLVSKPK